MRIRGQRAHAYCQHSKQLAILTDSSFQTSGTRAVTLPVLLFPRACSFNTSYQDTEWG